MERSRRRYALRRPELNQAIEALLEQAQAAYGPCEDIEFVRQIMVSAISMLRDRASGGDLKLVNNALKELRHAFRVFAPYRYIRKLAVFGSARTQREHPDWRQAYAFAERMADHGWMTITGAGDGIMGAAQGGAGREASFGVNIRLPFEQDANEVIAGDHKLINFRYFFTRKVVFVKEAHAIALFPGGFGTHDEGFEALTLLQTGKSEMLPIVFLDSPGGTYWKEWQQYLDAHLRRRGLISDEDLRLFKITDDVDQAVAEILGFYSNYHSSRYVRDRLVVRVQRAPNAEQLEALNREFADILTRGRIRVSDALPEEAGEVDELPRVTLHLDRREVGRLRMLIDRLNSFPDEALPPSQASPHQIVPSPLSPDAESEELEEL